MARAKPRSLPKAIQPLGRPQIYAEGPNDYDYLTALAASSVILPYKKGTELMASQVKPRIESIKKDLDNDAIECVIWIVDGGDEHINGPKHFIEFYKEWQGKKDGEWKKLHVLINAPCLEYWFLLHRTDPPLDAKDAPICFENAKTLDDSAVFKKFCEEGKGANLVKAIVRDAAGRKQAIKRAEDLSAQLNDLPDKKLLKIARAEMYQVFELIKGTPPNYLWNKEVE
jgi:hypothetical protein